MVLKQVPSEPGTGPPGKCPFGTRYQLTVPTHAHAEMVLDVDLNVSQRLEQRPYQQTESYKEKTNRYPNDATFPICLLYITKRLKSHH